MPLSEAQREALRAAAEERGLDPEELIRRGEEQQGGSSSGDGGGSGGNGGGGQQRERPLLIGHLPLIKVRELRKGWLAHLDLDDDFPDQDLPISLWMQKYGVTGGGGSPGGE